MDPLAQTKANILARIEKNGFTVLWVHGTEELPAFAYTVGLCAKTKDEREIITFGLPPEVAIEVLNIVSRRLVDGEEMPAGKDIDRVLVGNTVRLHRVNAKKFSLLGNLALWYAEEILKRKRPVQAFQLLWPDRFGMWPGTPGFTARRSQPLL